MNSAILIGTLNSPASNRLLPSGLRVTEFELNVARPGERQDVIPVVFNDAPASLTSLDVDASVLVVGRVRRRFFRSADHIQSRTEVLAESVTLTRHRKRACRVLGEAVAGLELAIEDRIAPMSQVG